MGQRARSRRNQPQSDVQTLIPPENKGAGTTFFHQTQCLNVSSLPYSLEEENDSTFIPCCWHFEQQTPEPVCPHVLIQQVF